MILPSVASVTTHPRHCIGISSKTYHTDDVIIANVSQLSRAEACEMGCFIAIHKYIDDTLFQNSFTLCIL